MMVTASRAYELCFLLISSLQAFFSYSFFLLLCLYIASLIVFSPVIFFIYREAFLFYFNGFFLTGYLIYPLFLIASVIEIWKAKYSTILASNHMKMEI